MAEGVDDRLASHPIRDAPDGQATSASGGVAKPWASPSNTAVDGFQLQDLKAYEPAVWAGCLANTAMADDLAPPLLKSGFRPAKS